MRIGVQFCNDGLTWTWLYNIRRDVQNFYFCFHLDYQIQNMYVERKWPLELLHLQDNAVLSTTLGIGWRKTVHQLAREFSCRWRVWNKESAQSDLFRYAGE